MSGEASFKRSIEILFNAEFCLKVNGNALFCKKC